MHEIHGQSRAIAQLQRALSSGRLASTWIFSGPEGVGKFTTAMEFAKAILCDHPRQVANQKLPQPFEHLPADFPVTVACGACDSCKAIAAQNHPDVHVVTRELIRMHDRGGRSMGTTMSVHVIRGEITGDPASGTESKMGKRSFRGRGKFFIVDQADLMEKDAQNTLLKTLEEPPPASYLVLITASPGELLPTIHSRSQLVEFHALPDATVIAALQTAGVNGEDAALLARLARGSLGRALLWAEDIRFIDDQAAQRAAEAQERAAKKKAAKAPAGDVDDEDPAALTPGGILGWTRTLAEKLDALVAGKAHGLDVADVIAGAAAEYVKLQKRRDRLASADKTKRDGITLMMSIAAEWFSDRLRYGLGTPHPTALPGQTGALDYALVPELIKAAREAEYWADRNVHDKMLLAATTTRWEELLHGAAV